jgi:hypothetical protein
MAKNFENKELKVTVITSRQVVAKRCRPFSALRKDFSGHKFKNVCELETIVTP